MNGAYGYENKASWNISICSTKLFGQGKGRGRLSKHFPLSLITVQNLVGVYAYRLDIM